MSAVRPSPPSSRCSRCSSRSAGPPRRRSCWARATSNSRVVKDRSLKTRDLSRGAVRDLRSTPNGSVTEAKIAQRRGHARQARRPARSGRGAIADSAVGGAQVANGSLTRRRPRPLLGPLPLDDRPDPVRQVLVGRADGPAAGAGGRRHQQRPRARPARRPLLERRLTFSVRASSDPRPLRALGVQRRHAGHGSRHRRVRGLVPLPGHRPALSAVAAHLDAGAAVLHRAPAAAAVAAGVEEQPAALSAALDAVGDRARPATGRATLGLAHVDARR